MTVVQDRMIKAQLARRGEYEPEKLSAIRAQGSAEVYAMVTSVKCRAAGSWIRDVLMNTSEARAWAIRPTPVPDLPPEINDAIVMSVSQAIAQAEAAGMPMNDQMVAGLMERVRDRVKAEQREQARKRAERMGHKMEDQLSEGGFNLALNQFIDDLTTYPAAIIKGPVVRRKATLKWGETNGDYTPVIEQELKYFWERVSPFDIYPSPQATNVDEGYLIEKHRLSRQDLQDLIGVEGYDEGAIRLVLQDYGKGGLTNWTMNVQNENEQQDTTAVWTNSEGLIDALQYWGSVPGSMLIEWGLTEQEVQDPEKEYHVEAWLIGQYVIKAMLNADPMCRKPYYKACYEEAPGSFWGNSVADLVADSQQVINAAARALVNNMGISSGPQVVVNVDRLPAGEDITQLRPWKIWQVNTDPMGNSHAVPPISFFQPNANVQELMTIFEKFSQLADEYSGIPRYLTGDTTGGAGRTASGLSMLINNAGKSIKQVISNIDHAVMQPLLERLYYYNMRYSEDPDLKGDVNIIASGSSALVAKETAMVRRNEFLAATANPYDMQVVGIEGRAAILREVAKGLDIDPEKVVPPEEVLRMRTMMQAQQAAAQAQQGSPENNKQKLHDDSPITDNFSPT